MSSARLAMTDYPLMDSCPNHICGIGEARHLNLFVLIDTQEY